MVIVDEGHPGNAHQLVRSNSFNPGCWSHILKRSIFLVVQELESTIQARGEIGVSITVIVAYSAACRSCGGIESSLLRHVLKLAISEIAVKRHPALGAVIREENVDLAVVVIIEETCATAGLKKGLGEIDGGLRCR